MDTTTPCPSLGTLRAHLDHDDDATAAHVDGCDACRATIVSVAATAGTTRRLLGLLDEPAEVAAPASASAPDGPRAATAPGGGREAAAAGPGRAGTGATAPPRGRRQVRRRLRERAGVLGGAVVLGVLGATVGQPVVANVLDSFRTEQVAPIGVGFDGIGEQFAALEGIADVTDVSGEELDGGADDIAAAAALAGVAVPDLDAVGPLDDAEVHATSATGVRVAFRTTSDVPERLRGVVVEILSPGALVVFPDGDRRMLVGTARGIEVTATGASLDVVRAAVLEDLDLPVGLREQLAGIDEWRTTLPVPVPVDEALWDEVTVGGARGLAIGHADGFAAVVWHDGADLRVFSHVGSVASAVELAARL